MAKIQPEVSARLALLSGRLDVPVRQPESGYRSGRPYSDRIYSDWHRALREERSLNSMTDLGYGWSSEGDAVQYLVSRGRIRPEDASAYIQQKYPSHSLASGRMDEQLRQGREQQIIEASSGASGKASNVEARRRLRTSIATQGLIGSSGYTNETEGVAASDGVNVPKLGDEYDPRQITKAIKESADQIMDKVRDIRRGNVQNPINSIDGASIRPGTLTSDKVDPEEFAAELYDDPQPKDTVTVKVQRDDDVDNDFSSNDTGGPGGTNRNYGFRRVSKVTSVKYPKGYKPKPGAQRLQVFTKGMEFGIMSFDGSATYMAVSYGTVIKNIPHHLGRVPKDIKYAAYSGYAPTGAEALYHNTTSNVGPDSVGYNTATVLFDSDGATSGRAYDEWVTEVPSFLETFSRAGSSYSSLLAPTTGDIARCEGVKFMLITGTTAKEVYAQLNSKHVNGASIGGNASGPSASCPPHLTMESPAPACTATQQGTSSSLNGFRRSNTKDVSLGYPRGKWRIGSPFSYDVCRQLVATDTHFSVVVQPDVRHVNGSVSDTQWDIDEVSEHGLKVVENYDREVGIDIVVI